MGVNLHVHLAPRQAQIRMMPFGFGDGAHSIHEVESGFEIGKQKAFRDVMLFDNLPVRQLLRERNEIGAL